MDTQSISSDEDDFILPSLCPSPIISSVGVGSEAAHSRVGGSEVGEGQSRSPSPDLADSSNTIGERGEREQEASRRATSSPPPTPPSEPPPQLIRHDTLWYHDGSIVLHVQDHLFKVHQTVLAAHSEVFAGLFTLPEGKDKDKGRIDGCPVVELQQDKWEDVEVLLRAIYEPAFWDTLQPTTPLPTLLPPLSSLLALSTKYIIPTLRTRTTTLLKSKFPTTYPSYIHRTQSAEKYVSSNIMLSIHLARSYDVPEVLPYLFYCLARLSNRRIMESKEGDVSWYLKSLSLVAREKLRLSEIALSHSFLYAFRPSPQCLTPPLCTLSRGPIIEWRLIEAQKNPAPLRGWDKWEKLGICERCVEWCKGEHERGRREVWERLPSLVGVAASWGVLREGGFELGDRA